MFLVAAQGEGNELKLNPEGGEVIVDVFSETGIGSGTVELVSGTPPETIFIRLHLSGLEQFRLTNGGTRVSASVSTGGRVSESLLPPGGGERPISALSPDWVDIRIVTDQEPAAIPLAQGYFEVSLPGGLFQAGSHSISMEWIDFFR